MKRPSFQFYPGDWRSNTKLRRCSPAARGVWLDILCVLHDSDEYGICRWPLAELAQVAAAPIKLVKELVEKGVLKGDDKHLSDPYIYVPRSGRKDGEPVELVSIQDGPVWYSSRMVKDEYVRTIRGEGSRFGATDGEAPKVSPKPTTKASPKPPFGDGSSSSSSSSVKKISSVSDIPIGFAEFWKAWPSTDRKTAKAECLKRWKSKHLEPLADQILAHVEAQKLTKKWLDGYEPAPLTYINQRRWEDEENPDLLSDSPWAGAK